MNFAWASDRELALRAFLQYLGRVLLDTCCSIAVATLPSSAQAHS